MATFISSNKAILNSAIYGSLTLKGFICVVRKTRAMKRILNLNEEEPRPNRNYWPRELLKGLKAKWKLSDFEKGIVPEELREEENHGWTQKELCPKDHWLQGIRDNDNHGHSG
ncbi:MAG: hypothetical protein HWN68_20075 [Desulfobacterales bacterium]|nr:hypothetical protein [Desulfobacterales bacterium]